MKLRYWLMVAAAFVSGGLVFAQGKEWNEDDISKMAPHERLAVAESFMELHARRFARDSSDDKAAEAARKRADDVIAVMVQAQKEPEVARKIIDGFHWRYQLSRARAGSAPQVTQIASETAISLAVLQAIQNDRIIRLLEELQKERGTPAKPKAP